MAFTAKQWANDELITAEDLNRLETGVSDVTAAAEKVNRANASAGTGTPTGTAPAGWYYTDISTGTVWQMVGAAWQKRPAPSPIALGSEHLDTVLTTGNYTQTLIANATKANGYPVEGRQILLRVSPLGSITVQEARALNGQLALRSCYQGKWTAWQDASGKAIA